MPGLLIPSRRIRTGRPTEFAAANPALDFAFLFNIDGNGFARNSASPYGKRHEIMPRPAANGCNGYGYGRASGDAVGGFAKGSLGRGAGATYINPVTYLHKFQNEASIKASIDTNEYTIIAVVEHANWMWVSATYPPLFSLYGTPASIYAHCRYGWSNTYLSFGTTASPAYSDLTPLAQTAVPYLVVARFTAGQLVSYSAERLGADPDWKTSNNTASAIQITQTFVNTYMGEFPGAIYIAGLSTRILTNSEISAISANLGFLFEPEDYFTPSGTGGFDPSHLVGKNSFHIGQAATGAINVSPIPVFYTSGESQTSFVGKKVVAGAFANTGESVAAGITIPKRRAYTAINSETHTHVIYQGIARRLLSMSAECRSRVSFVPKPRQTRRLDVTLGTDIAFAGRRVAASPLSASCSSSVSEDSTAVVGGGMESEAEAVLSLSVARIATARIATTCETQVDFSARNEATAHENEATVLTGTTQIGAITDRQEVVCLT